MGRCVYDRLLLDHLCRKPTLIQIIAQLFNLRGRGAIATGRGSGIGQATALRLAEAGSNVVVTDIDQTGTEETVKRIENGSGRAHHIQVNNGSCKNQQGFE